MTKTISKYLPIVCVALFSISCGELQQVINQLPQSTALGNSEIAAGLREALHQGIDKQVSKLADSNGFYKNSLVKILLPEELQKVDGTLRDIGLGSLADQGLKLLNSAAENAVKEATPIFIDAINTLSISDAKSILLGPQDAATSYLKKKTSTSLFEKFEPIIKISFDEVGANKIWSNIINRYNAIPLTKTVNPNLTDYVTTKALEGVFTMIAIEESEIRSKYSARTTGLLKRVFALQDQ
jgi:hypothetical protein